MSPQVVKRKDSVYLLVAPWELLLPWDTLLHTSHCSEPDKLNEVSYKLPASHLHPVQTTFLALLTKTGED